MAITNGYLTLDQAKQALATGQTVEAANDTLIERAVEAASRAIDRYCARIFYDTGSTTARTYRADDLYELDVDDFHTETGLVVRTDTTDDGTFDTTWTSDQWQLEPLVRVNGWPYTRIVAVDTKTFPRHARRPGVEVAAQWGWAAVPLDVELACQILMAKYFHRKDTPQGVAGFSEFGVVRLISGDRDVTGLLDPFRRHLVAGVV